MLRRLADKADRWEVNGLGISCRKRVQVKTLADLKALGEEIAATGPVLYKVNGVDKSLDEIGGMTDAQLNEISLFIYPPNVVPQEAEMGWLFSLVITNAGHSAAVPGRFYMAINRGLQTTLEEGQIVARLERAKQVAESCTRVVRWWRALAPYPVVQTITKATAQQRAHDTKIRWQTALITLGLSIPAAVITAVLTVLWTPKP